MLSGRIDQELSQCPTELVLISAAVAETKSGQKNKGRSVLII